MPKIKLTFDLPPVAQARPRAPRFGRGIRLYDLKQVHAYKAQLAESARFMYHGKPLSGPLRVELWFYRSVQKSLSKKERSLRLAGAHRPTVKSDVDNYIKSTLDGLTGLLWEDDRQIVDIVAHKYYSDQPRIEIEVEEVKDDDL